MFFVVYQIRVVLFRCQKPTQYTVKITRSALMLAHVAAALELSGIIIENIQ